MRDLTVVASVGIAALAFASSASAAPTVSLIWTGTTGSGSTGSNTITALPGDSLQLHMFASDATNGIAGVFLSLSWSAGLTGVAATDCPNATSTPTGGNILAGSCTPTGFTPPFLSPFILGVTITGNTATQFDAATPPQTFTTAPVEIGAMDFDVISTGTVSLPFIPGDSVVDGTFVASFPTAIARVVIPEPATAALIALGLGALAFASRAR